MSRLVMTDSTFKTEYTFTTMNGMFEDYNEFQFRTLVLDHDEELENLLEEQWPVEELPQDMLAEF